MQFVDETLVRCQLGLSVRRRELVVCERRQYRCRCFCWLTCRRWNQTVSDNLTTTPSQQYVHGAHLKSTTMNRWSPVDWCWCAVLNVPPTTKDARRCHRWRRRRHFCCLTMKVTGTSARCWRQLDKNGLAEQLQERNYNVSFQSTKGYKETMKNRVILSRLVERLVTL